MERVVDRKGGREGGREIRDREGWDRTEGVIGGEIRGAIEKTRSQVCSSWGLYTPVHLFVTY